MKTNISILVVAVIISAISAPSNYVRADTIPIFDDVRDSSGQLSLRYVTENGITVTETGHFKALPSLTRGGPPNYVYVKEGSYSFTSPEGQFHKVDYIADENGYRVKGNTQVIPKAPVFAPYA